MKNIGNLIKIFIGLILITVSLTDIANVPIFQVKNKILLKMGYNLDERWLSGLYRLDMGNPNNQQRIKLYQEQIVQGNPYVAILLSTTFLNRHGESRQPDKLQTLLNRYDFKNESLVQLESIADVKLSSARAVSEAMYLLGNYHYHMKEYNQSKIRLEQAFDHNEHPPAMNLLGYVHRKGLGDAEKSITEAIDCYKKSAELKYSRAMTNLAYLYESGYSTKEGKVEPKLNKAHFWYKQAAELGNATGIYRLGFFIYEGKGREISSPKKAIEMYQKAAELGNKYAMYETAKAYETGEWLTEDKEKAIEWYKKSRDAGYAKAGEELDKLKYL